MNARGWVVVLAGCAATTCVKPAADFACDTSDQCTPGGTCELTGWCSFPDASCPSGRRYGAAAGGGLAGDCVALTVDGGNGVCGNAMVEAGEDCDDDDDNTDGCVDCHVARCGDNAIRAGVEDCDDGNTADGDACNSICLDCTADQAVVWPVNGHCYMRFTTATTWDLAAANCVARGGYLVSYDSTEENAFVIANLVGAVDAWIGLDDYHEANFWWQDDEVLTFAAWSAGEPNGGIAENCSRQIVAGTWNTTACGNALPYVCERAPWTIDPATRSAYRYIGGVGELFYPEALAACAALGGGAHLATVTTAAENAVVDAITGATVAWLGGNDVTTEGSYVWETAEPFTFNRWAPLQPDGAALPTEDCIGMRSDGWYDLTCSGGFQNSGFFCEVDP